jgi:hypothetical protein
VIVHRSFESPEIEPGQLAQPPKRELLRRSAMNVTELPTSYAAVHVPSVTPAS